MGEGSQEIISTQEVQQMLENIKEQIMSVECRILSFEKEGEEVLLSWAGTAGDKLAGAICITKSMAGKVKYAMESYCAAVAKYAQSMEAVNAEAESMTGGNSNG